MVPVPVAHVSATAATSALSALWQLVSTSSGKLALAVAVSAVALPAHLVGLRVHDLGHHGLHELPEQLLRLH